MCLYSYNYYLDGKSLIIANCWAMQTWLIVFSLERHAYGQQTVLSDSLKVLSHGII